MAAVAVCSQVNTHVFVDRAGRPLLPAIVWQDQRSRDAADALNLALSVDDRIRLFGSPRGMDGSTVVARMEWMRRECPDEWSRARAVLSPKDYLNYRLTGELLTDPLSPVGLIDEELRYRQDIVDLTPGGAALLPPLRQPAEPQGRLAHVAEGFPPNCLVSVATMDAWANLWGSGVVTDGQAMLVAGTSEIVGVLSRHRLSVPGVVSFPPYAGLTLHAGPTQAGGDSLRWFAQANGVSLDEILTEAAAVPAGSLALVFLPHLAGERAPLWDARLRGAFLGLSVVHQRRHLSRAVLEGVAYSGRHLLEACSEAAGCTTDSLRLSGGGSRSALWCQIKADVLGLPLHRLRVLESGVLGSALIASVTAGLHKGIMAAAEMVQVERTFLPDPAANAAYHPLYRAYRAAHGALAPVHEALQAAERGPGADAR